MRIISGKYKGRKIEGFDIEGTRPTQDRLKESLFGMIQNDIYDSVCLDLFSGSGSLGIEALSNYAKKVYFVDKNNKCIEVLKSNLSKIDDNYEMFNNDYKDALNTFKNNNLKFDIVFLDPPYKLDCINGIINFIIENKLLNIDGLIVCEYEFDTFENNFNSLELIKERKYGYKSIKIYKRVK